VIPFIDALRAWGTNFLAAAPTEVFIEGLGLSRPAALRLCEAQQDGRTQQPSWRVDHRGNPHELAGDNGIRLGGSVQAAHAGAQHYRMTITIRHAGPRTSLK
jgi:hypothetical protein